MSFSDFASLVRKYMDRPEVRDPDAYFGVGFVTQDEHQEIVSALLDLDPVVLRSPRGGVWFLGVEWVVGGSDGADAP